MENDSEATHKNKSPENPEGDTKGRDEQQVDSPEEVSEGDEDDDGDSNKNNGAKKETPFGQLEEQSESEQAEEADPELAEGKVEENGDK